MGIREVSDKIWLVSFMEFDPGFFDEDATGAGLASSLLEDARVATLPAEAFFLPASHLGLRLAIVDFDGSRAFDVFPRETDPHTLFPNLVAGCDALQRYVEGLGS